MWTFATVVLAGIAISTLLSTRPLQSGGSEVDQLARDDQALLYAGNVRVALAEWQFYLEPNLAKLSSTASQIDPVDLAKGSRIAEAEIAQVRVLSSSLQSLGLSDLSRNLERSQAAFTLSLTGIAPLANGRPDDVRVRVVNAERAALTQLWLLTSSVSTAVRALRDADLRETADHLGTGRSTVLVVEALSALAVVGTAIVVGRRAERRERAERAKIRRHEHDMMLQRALEMSEGESDTFVVANKALEVSVPHLQVEMLLADSSRAHFHQTFVTDTAPDARSGCGVVSPLLCPATKRGQTLLFESSRAIDACPYLRNRASGECAAACVAVSIAGKTVGVLHATGPDMSPPTESDVRYLEETARQTSERIGMLRAFEKSETQAHSDPLTGLMNRRSLENQVNDLERSAIPYAVAYGDLDHFKLLNDTHGHEAGDQALRLFSRVLRDSVRPADLAARYGGEEFVVVLPDCNPETANAVLERVRERLALALTSGRVPSFTVSFGLATSTEADTFDETVALADHALLAAKAQGRNRVVGARQRSGAEGDDIGSASSSSDVSLMPTSRPSP